MNGATGEYPMTALDERNTLASTACNVAKGRADVLCGVGSTHFSDVVTLGKAAAAMGASAVLLPPRHFFQYAASDLEAYYRQASQQIARPILIYNLPAFTTAIEPGLALRLIGSVPHIRGIKHSSGSLETLEALTRGDGLNSCRIVGNDSVLCEALENGLCDGVVSGVAGVVPELIAGLFQSHHAGDRTRFATLGRHLRAFINEVDRFPTPWGLKLVAEYRGFFKARFPLPVAEERRRQADLFEQWFRSWWELVVTDLGEV
jgi:4-hydroxy-tetrahydrodipicolinate synthase